MLTRSTKVVSATKNIALTVRSVSTIGNYDYTFDYVFYLDGSFETIVRASGYIQSATTAPTRGTGTRSTTGSLARCTTTS